MAYCSKVRYGGVIRVRAAGPHGVDQDLAQVQQHTHLGGGMSGVRPVC